MPREKRKFTKERPTDPDSVEAQWRLFVAVDFPESRKAVLDELLANVREANLPIRWIGANAAHLTLHFIGDVPVETAELLRLAFSSAAGGTHPFSLKVDGAGAFPNLNKPQIVWLGLAGDIASLRRLHRASETFLLGFDITTEQREFKPHITLGRARQPLQSPEINALISQMRSETVQSRLTELAEPFRVDHLTLYRSHLSHEGATYEPLATARLG
jgi:RNA 2',3'-cyclic 3'-phosphodiesterase